jgi:predicted dehydrogenase
MQSRRNFLQKVSVTAIGLPFLACENSGSFLSLGAKEGPVLRVALMGLGSYANRVAEAMKDCKRAKVTGLISGTPQKLKDWSQKYGVPEQNCYNYENFDRIRDNKEIDAVYIITPNAQHHPQTIRVARAGKHVICEKPMAINATQAREMVEECRKAGVHLLIGYRMHFEPKTMEIVRMRREGELGKVLFFQGLSGFRIGDPNQWRLKKDLAGGGALMDIGIYAVNGSRYMIGEDPVWVTAQETKTDPQKFAAGVDETITFQLGFPGGATASCLSTYSMSNLDRFFLNGDKGFAELQPATGYGPIKGRTNKGELTQPHTTHQTLQMDAMAEMILDGKKAFIPVDGEEGRKDMVILDGIYEAVRTGGKVPLKYGV